MMRALYFLLLAGVAMLALAGCGASSAGLDESAPAITSSVLDDTVAQTGSSYNYSLQSGQTGQWYWPWSWNAPTSDNSLLGGRGSVIAGETGVPIGGAGGDEQSGS